MELVGNYIKIVGLKINHFKDTKIVFDGCACTPDEANEIIKSFDDEDIIFVRIPCTFTYET